VLHSTTKPTSSAAVVHSLNVLAPLFPSHHTAGDATAPPPRRAILTSAVHHSVELQSLRALRQTCTVGSVVQRRGERAEASKR